MIPNTTSHAGVEEPKRSNLEYCTVDLRRTDDDTLMVRLAGAWIIKNRPPNTDVVINRLDSESGIRRVCFETEAMTAWDSRLLTFLIKIHDYCDAHKIAVDPQCLPGGVRGLLTLAHSVPERKGAHRKAARESLLSRIGNRSLVLGREIEENLSFLGEACLSFGRFFVGRARYRRSDLLLMIQECGPAALPIVTLISVLVGLILAFVGAVQLQMFGAQIYVANLVGLGMTREMGAMMAAIIMAGRTGAAFAAQLGSMQVNEEIDAFRTMGIPPMDFLVLPRMLALIVMMPMLALYADFMGILGGLVVGVGMLDITLLEYYHQTEAAIGMNDVLGGLFKSVVFGVLVALAGCLRGMQCGRSSSAVGEAATRAVVTGIVWIIVSDSILTLIYNALAI
jgi:phospholipid/cholesterol/gamma-HCH transport system permease protein